ncbi:MAG: MqnA/MqnD/SBP family protein [Campylobacterota bacterium]
MIFGSIEYLNLLPFRVFYKKHFPRSALMHYKKGVPSHLNREFMHRRIDAAFISSIRAQNCRCYGLGIAAQGSVKSVFVKKGLPHNDAESETSNALAGVLGIQGEVLIGDKALKRYLSGEQGLIDLAEAWQEQTGLPFVFARLCYNKGYDKHFERKFLRQKTKIPQYILKSEAKKRGIDARQLLWYLKFIKYEIGYEEKRALKLFYKKAAKLPKT